MTDAMTPEQLEGCPFCGREARITCRAANTDDGRGSHVAFAACYCDGYSACAHKMGFGDGPEEAIAAVTRLWNTRAGRRLVQAGEQHGFIDVPKSYIDDVERASDIASRYSPCIDAVEESGGEESEDPIWAVHHILYYAHFKLRAGYKDPSPAEALQPASPDKEEVIVPRVLLEDLISLADSINNARIDAPGFSRFHINNLMMALNLKNRAANALHSQPDQVKP